MTLILVFYFSTINCIIRVHLVSVTATKIFYAWYFVCTMTTERAVLISKNFSLLTILSVGTYSTYSTHSMYSAYVLAVFVTFYFWDYCDDTFIYGFILFLTHCLEIILLVCFYSILHIHFTCIDMFLFDSVLFYVLLFVTTFYAIQFHLTSYYIIPYYHISSCLILHCTMFWCYFSYSKLELVEHAFRIFVKDTREICTTEDIHLLVNLIHGDSVNSST